MKMIDENDKRESIEENFSVLKLSFYSKVISSEHGKIDTVSEKPPALGTHAEAF